MWWLLLARLYHVCVDVCVVTVAGHTIHVHVDMGVMVVAGKTLAHSYGYVCGDLLARLYVTCSCGHVCLW